MMKLLLKIGKSTLIQTGYKVLSLFISLFLVYSLTRYLGPDEYGKYIFTITFVSFFAILSDLGLNLTVVRDYSVKKVERSSFLSSFFYLKLILTFISTLIPIVIVFMLPYEISTKIAICVGSISVAFSNFSGWMNTIYQAEGRIDLVSLLDFCSKCVTAVLTYLSIRLNLSIYHVIAAIGVGNIFSLLLSIAFSNRYWNLNQITKPDIYKLNILMRSSIGVGITSLLAFGYFKLDTLFLSLYKPAAEMGYYGLAYKIYENILMVWGFYMAAAYPVLAVNIHKDRTKFKQIYKTSLLIAILGGIVSCISLIWISTGVINILAGKQFGMSSDALRILVLSLPLIFVNNINYHVLVLLHKAKIIILVYLISIIFNSAVNLYLIPMYGYIGSSVTTVITELSIMLMYVLLIRKYLLQPISAKKIGK